MRRSYLFVSSSKPRDARRAVIASLSEPDLAVVSPSDDAYETACYAVGGRWIATREEPLLAVRSFAESGADVLARFARVMRGLIAYEARSLLVVIDGLDVLGATAFRLAEDGLLRWADDLDQSLPLP
jgi:hypothetical protein